MNRLGRIRTWSGWHSAAAGAGGRLCGAVQPIPTTLRSRPLRVCHGSGNRSIRAGSEMRAGPMAKC